MIGSINWINLKKFELEEKPIRESEEDEGTDTKGDEEGEEAVMVFREDMIFFGKKVKR